MKDLTIYDNGQGGDYTVENKDLGITNNLHNQVYLALFGTKTNTDYWANNILDTKFRSLTQEFLDNMPTTSAARTELTTIIKKDLEYLQINDIDVSFGINKVTIFVNGIAAIVKEENKIIVL